MAGAAKKKSVKPSAKKKVTKKTVTKKAAKKTAPSSKNENKTQATSAGVDAFINAIENDTRKRDAKTILAMMKRVTGLKPRMWGSSIIGFGEYHYKYDSGREGDFMMIGFSPRKANLVCYIMLGLAQYPELLSKLGPYKIGKSCLYLGDFDKLDLGVLEKLCAADYAAMCKKYGKPKA